MKVTTLKGVFPDPKPVRRKNFILENVKSLRRMEQCFQANKEVDELQKLSLHKYQPTKDKYQKISARVVTSFREKKNQEDDNIDSASKDKLDSVLTEKTENENQKAQNQNNLLKGDKKHNAAAKKTFKSGIDNDASSKQKRCERTSNHRTQQKLQPKIPSDRSVPYKSDNVANKQNTLKYKSQGIQTLDTEDIESIYSEGVIRYPSKKVTNHDTNSDQEKEKTSKQQADSPADRGDMHTPESTQLDLRNSVSPPHRDEIDFVKLNKERVSVANKLVTQLNNGTPPPPHRKGVVPKYLRERKEAQEKEQKAKTEALQSDCPEGHVPLPDHERQETLQLLKKNYQEYVNELNMMPIKTDTLRAQRRKIEIEKQLTKLEEGIKVFSRPKVYVKINA